MTNNPLEDSPERESRIREHAYRLWEQDGRPEGRDGEFWERARELVGMEESPGAGLVHDARDANSVGGEVVDEAALQDNLGEFPERSADQGEHRQAPMTRAQLKSRSGR